MRRFKQRNSVSDSLRQEKRVGKENKPSFSYLLSQEKETSAFAVKDRRVKCDSDRSRQEKRVGKENTKPSFLYLVSRDKETSAFDVKHRRVKCDSFQGMSEVGVKTPLQSEDSFMEMETSAFDDQELMTKSDWFQGMSAVGVKTPLQSEDSFMEKETSAFDDEELMTKYDSFQANTYTGVMVPLESENTFMNEAAEEMAKEMQYVTFDNLSLFFDGTEQQVLYRVNMLVHQHVNLNKVKKDSDGFGILHHAVINKFVTVAEKIIENGATILEEDNEGYNPLHYAMGEAFRMKLQKDDLKVTDMEQPGNGFIGSNTARNTTEGKLVDKETKKRNCKCDEMAALIISKMKPFRVRQMFGDKEDLEIFEMNEAENAEFQNSTDSEVAPSSLRPQSTSPTSGRPDAQDNPVCKEFQFMDVIKDKLLPETARAILDKLEDTDPKTNEPSVYIDLLTRNEVQNKNKNEKTECPFHFIARNRVAFINHPVCRAVASHKWKDWAFYIYLTDTILHFLSFTALTICTVVGAQSDSVFIYDSPWQYTRLSLEIFMCLFILRSLFTEVIQFIIDPKDYIKSVMNWIEFSSAVLLIIEIGLRFAKLNAHWYVFAVGYVLWTVKGIKYAAVTSQTAAYSETLRAIMIRDFWLFAIFFVVTEMVFAGTFLLVLKATDSLEIHPETTTILGIYYVGLRTMIEGGMPIDYINFPIIAQFVIIVFMSLTIVVMLNILIAQLSNTYETAYADGKIKAWVHRAEAIVNYEKEEQFKEKSVGMTLCRSWTKLFLRCMCRSKANSTEEKKLEFNKEDILEEKEKMDKMQSTLKLLESKLIHSDLTIQTIKTRQNVLLHAVRGKSVGDSSQPGRGTTNIMTKDSALHQRVEQMESNQRTILRNIEELKSIILAK